MGSSEYNDITVLKGLAHCRQRPGMYLGNFISNDFNSALQNMFREVLGNSLDEFMGGHCELIEVTLNFDNSIIIRDYARGIPFSWNERENMSNLELAVGIPNSGAKFNKENKGSPFKISIGLNGIGVKAVNACSEVFKATSFRDLKKAEVIFNKGKKISFEETDNDQLNGTQIYWKPDPSILDFKYESKYIHQICHEAAYLNAGLKINLKTSEGTETFHEPKGIESFITDLTKNRKTLVSFPTFEGLSNNGNLYRLAMKIMDSSAESYYPYVNGNNIEESSTPVVAIRKAFARAISKYINNFANLKKKDKKLEIHPRDLRAGITAVIKILHIDPVFDAQTKTKLINTDISTFIQEDLIDKILSWLLEHPKQAAILIRQALIQAKARIAATNARKQVMKREKKNFSEMNISLDIFTPPLTDDPKRNRLYLFEGLSASGALVQAAKNKDRDTGELYKKHIGVLALKGVTLNCLELPIERAMKNTELATLVEVSGLNIKDPSDLSGLNFNEFIIACDEDSGGSQITSLLIIFFLTYFPEIIQQGRLCRIITPLFEVRDLKTKKPYFIYSYENWKERALHFGYNPKDINRTFTLKRNKGLGEMSKESNMTLVENPILKYIKYEDIEDIRKLFFVFSGKKFVKSRRELIFKLGLD